MSKKIVVKSTADVEELYQLFKKKLEKDFKADENAEEQGQRMIKFLMKKSTLSESMAGKYVQEFLETLVKELDLDEEKSNGS